MDSWSSGLSLMVKIDCVWGWERGRKGENVYTRVYVDERDRMLGVQKSIFIHHIFYAHYNVIMWNDAKRHLQQICSKMGHSQPLFLFSSFNTVVSRYVHFKMLPVTGFEPRTSVIGNNRSPIWATTTSQSSKFVCAPIFVYFFSALNKSSSRQRVFNLEPSVCCSCVLLY